MLMAFQFEGVGKFQQAAREIRPGIAFQIENDWLLASLYPDFAAHDSLFAVINLATQHAIMS